MNSNNLPNLNKDSSKKPLIESIYTQQQIPQQVHQQIHPQLEPQLQHQHQHQQQLQQQIPIQNYQLPQRQYQMPNSDFYVMNNYRNPNFGYENNFHTLYHSTAGPATSANNATNPGTATTGANMPFMDMSHQLPPLQLTNFQRFGEPEPDFTESDIRILKSLLLPGEKVKWKHVSNKMQNNENGKKASLSSCAKKANELLSMPKEDLQGSLKTSLPYVVAKDGWDSIDKSQQINANSNQYEDYYKS